MRHTRRRGLPAIFALALALSGFAVRLSPAQAPARNRTPRPEDVQAQLLNYYRQYPDRYLRVEKHTWILDPKSHISYHTLTLRNNAGVAYGDIEICFSFQTEDGKTRGTQTVKISGRVAPYQTFSVSRLPVKNTRSDCDTVTGRVAAAVVYR